MRRSMFDTLYLFAAVSMLAASLLLVSADMAQADTADERALRGAAADGNRDKVESLLARGTDPNVPDYNGWTALHHAANIAETFILTVLLEAGADPDARNSMGESPLHLAADFPYFEPASQAAVRVLLQSGADPDIRDTNKRTPLHVAARMHRHAVSIEDMLQSGANSNQRDFTGMTPLHSAVSGSSKFSADVVDALVDGGASASIASGRGETPLQLFARVGSNDGRIVRALVDGGANPDRKNPEGETPLHTAIRNGGNAENPDVIETLLATGADPCIKDASGYVPYNTAREGGDVHRMLANAGGSDIGCQGSDALVADYLVDSADWPGETTTRANIRTGPGRDYDVLETLDADTAVQVTGRIRNKDWLRIEVAGDTAFIHASLVKETEITTAMETSQDAESAVEDSGAQLEAVQAETDEMLALIDRDDDSTLTVAEISEDVPEEMGGESAAQDNTTSADTTVVSIDTEPKCTDDTPMGTSCWWELDEQPGCHVWNDSFRGPRDVTWAGTCSGSFAAGNGSLTEFFPPPPTGNGEFIRESVGMLVEGIRQGHWSDTKSFSKMEGEYVDGKRHGHWVREGGGYADYFEGPYVDGVRQGYWTGNSFGTFFVEGAFVDDKQSGLWIWDDSQSSIHSERTFLEGKSHGQSYTRNQMGEIYYQCWQHGEEVAC